MGHAPLNQMMSPQARSQMLLQMQQQQQLQFAYSPSVSYTGNGPQMVQPDMTNNNYNPPESEIQNYLDN